MVPSVTFAPDISSNLTVLTSKLMPIKHIRFDAKNY